MRQILAAAMLLVPSLLTAQAPLRGFKVNGDVSMRVWLPGGKVRVAVWDRDSIQVSGTLGRGTHIFAGGSGQSAKIGVDWDDRTNTGIPRADLVVTVPRKAHVWIKMTDGDVNAAGTAGQLDVITVTGTIAVRDAAGVVSVETIDAAVTLTSVSGDLRVRSGSGRVVLSQIHATLTVAAVGGVVDLTGVALQDARIETIGGAIAIRGSVARDALLDLETHNGPITLSLDRMAVPALTLTSRAGKVGNTLAAGSPAFGKITAYTFKGEINAGPASGIDMKKANTPP